MTSAKFPKKFRTHKLKFRAANVNAVKLGESQANIVVSRETTPMVTFTSAIVLATLALASVAQDTGGCPGAQVLVAPCTIAQAGETITEDEALKSVSDIVSAASLSILKNETLSYISFTKTALEENPGCQIPTEEACTFLPCGCEGIGRFGRKLQGLFLFGCSILPPRPVSRPDPDMPGEPDDSVPDPIENTQCLPPEPVEEVVVTVCRDDQCTGFVVQNRDIAAARNEVCGEEVTESCVVATAPTCPACVPKRCCNSEKGSKRCVCRDCPGKTLRREKTETGIVTLRSSKGGDGFPECTCS